MTLCDKCQHQEEHERRVFEKLKDWMEGETVASYIRFLEQYVELSQIKRTLENMKMPVPEELNTYISRYRKKMIESKFHNDPELKKPSIKDYLEENGITSSQVA